MRLIDVDSHFLEPPDWLHSIDPKLAAEIPAGDPNFRSDAVTEFAAPVKVVSVQPHMHLRGKAMQLRAVYPDGTRKALIDVPKYDFNWQTTYFLKQPVTVPAGGRIECAAWFDNSPNNKFNPDPKATVRFGEQSDEDLKAIIAYLRSVPAVHNAVPAPAVPPPALAAVSAAYQKAARAAQ